MNNPFIEKKGLSIDESCVYLGGLSRPTLYRLLAQGALRSYRIGTRRFCLRVDLDAYLETRVGEEEAKPWLGG